MNDSGDCSRCGSGLKKGEARARAIFVHKQDRIMDQVKKCEVRI